GPRLTPGGTSPAPDSGLPAWWAWAWAGAVHLPDGLLGAATGGAPQVPGEAEVPWAGSRSFPTASWTRPPPGDSCPPAAGHLEVFFDGLPPRPSSPAASPVLSISSTALWIVSRRVRPASGLLPPVPYSCQPRLPRL